VSLDYCAHVLEFAQKVLELLASTHLLPCDRHCITDLHAAPWLLYTCACLLTLHRAEENFYHRLQAHRSDSELQPDKDPEPCLIERSMMDITDKLADGAAERSLQVALVLGR
jgi:hypothetical protein